MKTQVLVALLGAASAQRYGDPSIAADIGGHYDADLDLWTPPLPGDANYENNCQRWGLTEQCNYILGSSQEDQTVSRGKKWKISAAGPLHARLWNLEKNYQEETIRAVTVCYSGADKPFLQKGSQEYEDLETAGKLKEVFFNGINDNDIMHRKEEDGSEAPCTESGTLFRPSDQYFPGTRVNNRIASTGRNTELWSPSNPPANCDVEASYTTGLNQDFVAGDHVTCSAEEDLWILVYDMFAPEDDGASDQDKLNGYEKVFGRFSGKESGCLLNDSLKFYMNYAQNGGGATAGVDECFNNLDPRYIQDATDPNFNRDQPWTPYYNCYAAPSENTVLSTLSFADCHEKSMQFFLQVEDDHEANGGHMRQEKFYLKASFDSVFQSIDVASTDIMRVDFYIQKDGVGRPQSFSMTPRAYEAVCDAYGVADAIACKSFNVYCTEPDDVIIIRVTGGGEFKMQELTCSDLLEEEFVSGGMAAYFTADEGTDFASLTGAEKWAYMEAVAVAGDYNEEEVSSALDQSGEGHTKMLFESVVWGQTIVEAKMKWWMGTYTVSNEPKCFTGDAFPFEVPQCVLRECNFAQGAASDQQDIHACAEATDGTWPLGLADLFLHNDVLNQAISGYATHGAMPASPVPGPADSTWQESWTGTSNTLQPSTSPNGLDTWYDFDQYEETGGYTGQLTITELPSCGQLTVLAATDIELVDNGDGTTTQQISADAQPEVASVNMHVDVTQEVLAFDREAGVACTADDVDAGELAFKGAFVARTQGFSAFVQQSTGAVTLGLQLASLSALLACLY